MNERAYKQEEFLKPDDEMVLITIAKKMEKHKLSNEFIITALNTARKYEGVADLLKMWRDEKNKKERDEIIADIQELIDDCNQKNIEKFSQIKMNDLESIAKDIRAFKDSLLEIVNKHGGINHLAELTGIPQPSLSRFFNSNAMPRRTTLLKIASALELDAITINTAWSR